MEFDNDENCSFRANLNMIGGFNPLEEEFRRLNIDFPSSLEKNVLSAIEHFIHQRDQLRNEASMLSSSLRGQEAQNSNLRKENERLKETIEELQRDKQLLNNRISALTMEHREVKNHWLAEKSDLQSRWFQIQALNTQMTATLKIKEKDYEKLQNQLSKLVRDTNKAQKMSIVITAPVKKNLSQDKSANAAINQILKDTQIVAMKNTIKSLQLENEQLRDTATRLESDLLEMQTLPPAPLPLPVPMSTATVTIQQPISSPLPPTAPAATVTFKSPVKEQAPSTPAVGTLANRYLASTPGAKPVQEIVDEACSNYRKAYESNTNHQVTTANTEEAQTRITSLRMKLAEALAVIQEQDRLIHEALLAKLPGAKDDVVTFEVDESDAEDENAEGNSKSKHIGKSIDDDLFNFKESDFLPPASPETLELLQAYGWSVPRQSIPANRPMSVDRRRTSVDRRRSLGKSSLMDDANKLLQPEQLEF